MDLRSLMLSTNGNRGQVSSPSSDEEVVGMDNTTLLARSNLNGRGLSQPGRGRGLSQPGSGRGRGQGDWGRNEDGETHAHRPFRYVNPRQVKLNGEEFPRSHYDDVMDIETSCGESSDETFIDGSDIEVIRMRKAQALSNNGVSAAVDERDRLLSLRSSRGNLVDEEGGSPPERPSSPVSSSSHSRDWSDCFGCKFGSPDQDPISGRNMNLLIKLFEDNYGKTDNLVLARMCHEFFKKNIYEPMVRMNMRVQMWTTRHIYEHFLFHNQEPRIFLGETIKKYKRISEKLEDMLFKEVPVEDGEVTVVVTDKEAFRQLLAVDKRIVELYVRQPRTMNFYNEKSYIELTQPAKYNINAYKNWTFE